MSASTHKFNENLHTVILSISLPVSEYLPKVEKKLKEYKNQVQVKGFRQGEVPNSLLKARFGNAVISDIVQETVNQELDNFLKTQMLDIIGSPLPLNKYDTTIQSPKDILIDIEIGYIPEFEIKGITKDIHLPFYQVDINEDQLEREIESQRRRLSNEFDDTVESIEEFDTVEVSISEVENGNPKTDGFFKDSALINVIKTSNILKENLLKASIGDKIITNLKDLDKDVSESRAKKLYFGATQRQSCSSTVQIEILKIKRIKSRELDTDFFKQLFQNENIDDLETFKDKMKQEIVKSYNDLVYDIYNSNIFDILVKFNADCPVPVNFMKRFVEETQLKGQKMSDNQLEPLLNSIRWDIISKKLATKFNINVSKEEVEYNIRMSIGRYYGFQISPFHNIFDAQVKKMMENEDTYRKHSEQIFESKLFAALSEEYTKDVIVVNADEFNKIYENFKAKRQGIQDKEDNQIEETISEDNQELS
jgi:trigger factor